MESFYFVAQSKKSSSNFAFTVNDARHFVSHKRGYKSYKKSIAYRYLCSYLNTVYRGYISFYSPPSPSGYLCAKKLQFIREVQ